MKEVIIIKNIIKLFTKRNYRFLMVTGETLPIYHDRFQTTNKTIVLVERQEDIPNSNATIIKGREHSSMFNNIRREYKKSHIKNNILECQNGVPIQIYKNFKKHTGKPIVLGNGIKEGMAFKISKLGFLGNSEHIYKVFLITDRYIFCKDPIDEKVVCYSHQELQRMKDGGALDFL